MMGPNQKRFKDAARELRKSGVAFRINVQSCCRGCVDGKEKLGMVDDDQAYGFIFAGQGQRIGWDANDQFVHPAPNYPGGRRNTPVQSVYINHGNESAQAIVDAFSKQGFDVEWDGTTYQCVIVHV